MAELHSEYSDSSCGELTASHERARVSNQTLTFPLPRTENGTFVCNECELKFAEDDALKQHMLQVHSDKPYKCDRCQAAFRYKGNLASHKTVHTGRAGDTLASHSRHL